MSKMELNANTDETGAIRIRLPGPPARYNVHVIVEWEEHSSSGWPPGWFEATAGGIGDTSFVRQPQGDYDVREDLE